MLDLLSRRVVGWATSDRLKRNLAVKALRRALVARNPATGPRHGLSDQWRSHGSIRHSDRGSQYCSVDYQALLRKPGIPAGVYAALHRNSTADRGVIIMSIFGFTIPSFVLALVLVLVFAVTLDWLPSGGQDTWRHAILPIATLSIGGIGILARFSRSAMIEVLGQPYIRTAMAKGLPWHEVVWKHALPNAAIPIITLVGFMVGALIAGAVVVESIFSWPGVGRLIVVSVANRDLAVVQCLLLVIAASMVLANLCVDFAYGLLDPRLRQKRTH